MHMYIYIYTHMVYIYIVYILCIIMITCMMSYTKYVYYGKKMRVCMGVLLVKNCIQLLVREIQL